MGTGVEVALAVSAATAAIGTGASIYYQNKAADAQEDASKASAAASMNDAADSRRAAAREARIKRAKILQSASNMGVAGASATTGATSELSGNLNQTAAQQSENILNAKTQSAYAGQISHANQMASTWSAIGQLGQQGLSTASMWDSKTTSSNSSSSG
jgi:hypothetical protein